VLGRLNVHDPCASSASTAQDDAKEVIPDEEIGTGRKKAKQNKDQTQTRIANMRVSCCAAAL